MIWTWTDENFDLLHRRKTEEEEEEEEEDSDSSWCDASDTYDKFTSQSFIFHDYECCTYSSRDFVTLRAKADEWMIHCRNLRCDECDAELDDVDFQCIQMYPLRKNEK
jgi:hypothetical protein